MIHTIAKAIQKLRWMMKQKTTLRLAAAILAVTATGGSATAMTTEYLTYDNGFTIELNFYDADDWNLDSISPVFASENHFDFTENMKNAIRSATDYWGNILAKGAKTTQPVQIFIRSDGGNYGSAFAGLEQNAPNTEWFIADQIIKGKVLLPYNGTDQYTKLPDTEPMAFGVASYTRGITSADVSTNYGWNTNIIHGITGDNGNSAIWRNLMGTTVHELSHIFGFNRHNHYMTEHMSDYYGNTYSLYKLPLTSELYTYYTGEKPGLNQYFVIVDSMADALADSEEYAKFFAHPETYFLYFTGDHVAEVLDGAILLGKANVIPIQGFELGEFDGNHCMIDSMMGHRTWMTYSMPIEADLAMLQDIGYNIDRKAYFGYSLYDSNRTETVTTGYSARNDEGTAYTGEYSNISYGVGLHIYGSDNTVTKKGNILTKGDAATGILVSGVRNTVTVDEGTEIHADGDYGVGVQAAYG